ncbi:hypothetical protein Mpal_2288 [Methanosphaerula palustris E1-9c]|uniref:Uncharacterized protein n=1 Tax=Methanosphaerula palustris (strain ATCC BAA-1556 / DSM 19958 / E1-9c) TaxID=521011 RepID=B8GE73_METPE|nr:hypothetical protein Mpal_2288 [Methanosphaerula palustris E1-9c]
MFEVDITLMIDSALFPVSGIMGGYFFTTSVDVLCL